MHLDDFDIARYLDGVVAGAEKQQFETHLADCALCAEAVASAYQMMEAVAADTTAPALTSAAIAEAQQVVTSAPRPALWLVQRQAFRWVAAAVVVMGLTVFAYIQMTGPETARFRTDGTDAGFAITTPEEGTTVEATALRFAWEPLAGTETYWVTVYTAEGLVAWKSHTKAVNLTLPDSVVLELGAAYLWNVEAFQPDGTTIRTDLHAFTLAPHDEVP